MTTAVPLVLALLALPGAREPPRGSAGARAPTALDEADRKLLRILRIARSLPEEMANRYRSDDPRWAEVIEAVLVERKIAVVVRGDSAVTIPLRRQPLRLPRYPVPRNPAQDEDRAQVLAMADCGRGLRGDVRTGVDLRMKVAPDGTLKEALILRFEPENPAAERCFLDVAKAWRFPKSFRQQSVQVRMALPAESEG